MVRQPHFWSVKHHPFSVMLTPISWLWTGVSALRAQMIKPYTSSVAVICIGNITAGGTGKTPTAITIAQALQGKKVAFLTRGYGGKQKRPLLIQNATDAAQYGDEAILLSRHAPTIVSKNRVAGLKIAEQQGFDVVIADDGFQNPSFAKTKSILVIDGAIGLGNGSVIPAGPLRESAKKAAARADAILIVGNDATYVAAYFPHKPVWRGDFKVAANAPDITQPYVAFAGIGRPEKFFNTLGDHGYMLAETVSFPDHHVYSDADIKRLQRLAQRHQAQLITTEKDRVKLPVSADIASLPVTMMINRDLSGFLS
ncbi:MAG TPA: tetraacyldisaccharide 4'-kinase [Alphaproteobacteria bacterium]